MFEYTNGFRKAMYWSKAKMMKHALRYSKAFAARKGYSYWEKDFDGMAYKTMLRQLISKWGIMSIDMQRAVDGDMATIKEDGTPEYVDNAPVEEPTVEEPATVAEPVTDKQETEISLGELK